MSTLFAFLHHLCAFTLVSALAIEFALIRSELTLASARRLQVTDLVLGIAAGALLVIGLLRVFFFEKGASYYFHSHAFLDETLALHRGRAVVDHSDHGVSVVARGADGGAGAGDQRQETEAGDRDHSRRTVRHRHHPALRRDHGAGRMGVSVVGHSLRHSGARDSVNPESLSRLEYAIPGSALRAAPE